MRSEPWEEGLLAGKEPEGPVRRALACRSSLASPVLLPTLSWTKQHPGNIAEPCLLGAHMDYRARDRNSNECGQCVKMETGEAQQGMGLTGIRECGLIKAEHRLPSDSVVLP